MTANVSMPAVGDLSGRRIYIQDIYPASSTTAAFRSSGSWTNRVEVWADIFALGTPSCRRSALAVGNGGPLGRIPMQLRDNDRWTAPSPDPGGPALYAIEGLD